MDFVFAMLRPSTTVELSQFYMLAITAFLAINIAWDIKSAKTPPFHFAHIGAKTSTLFSAASLASSYLVLVSTFDENVKKLAGDAVAPLVLAGASGILLGLSELCPYRASLWQRVERPTPPS